MDSKSHQNTVEDIQSIVSSLKQKNIGVLITDHNVRETLSITDRSYLLFDGKPYLIQIDATRLERPNLYLKESFHVARAVFERDDVYTTVITAFRKGLALYLLKVCNVRNQSLLAEPLKDYLMNNWERIQSS